MVRGTAAEGERGLEEKLGKRQLAVIDVEFDFEGLGVGTDGE